VFIDEKGFSMPDAEQPRPERIIPRVIDEEMKVSYLGYSMSVIVGRALPDARDGLKPVHRRILYGMWDTGVQSSKPTRKCARIVGDVMGRYHPHGNLAVYDALVRMAQDWNLRYPLIQGQGNFGSVDGDPPAADRYTEAKLNKLSEELLQDLDKKTVPFVPNFDATLEEPTVLPAKVPNLLVNGSTGIAVGMATNIPPHNLREVCDGIIRAIENPAITSEELMASIPAPDFPTGGIIAGRSGLREAYTTGRGKITIRSRITTEEAKGRVRLIVHEIPYMVNKAQLIEDMADQVRDKKLQGIADIRDESDRDGLRIVIDLKGGANPEVVLNQLFARTRLQESFGITMLALVENQPRILALKDLVEQYVRHRQVVVRKRTAFDLQKAEEQAHLLEGLITAIDHIDEVVALIKGARSVDDARTGLMQDYKLSERQAQAILDMALRRLAALERDKIRAEHAGLLTRIAELKAILASEPRILSIIKDELRELQQKYGDNRRTQLLEAEAGPVAEEALIKPEDMVVTITHAGYVKRQPVEAYKAQRRGGKGIVATEAKEEDFVEQLFVANTRDTLLFFTSQGRVHWLKVWQLPEAARYARGTAIVNLVQLGKDEQVTSLLAIRDFAARENLFMVTAQGTVKKTALEEFSNPRRGGIIAMGIDPGDRLISVLRTDGRKEVIIATANGMAIRFSEDDVRVMGRPARGVTGISLRDKDIVVGATLTEPGTTLLAVTEHGYGKRTPVDEYRQTRRGGVGVTTLKVTDKTGKVVAVRSVRETDELMLLSQKGIALRTSAKQVPEIGRSTQGVRLMRLDEGDRLAAIAPIAAEENDGGAGPHEPGA
jgi:DNA gyrase subunit A